MLKCGLNENGKCLLLKIDMVENCHCPYYRTHFDRCEICGNIILNIDDCEIDHIIPFAKGGKTELSNAQIVHRFCNREKSDAANDTWEDEEN